MSNPWKSAASVAELGQLMADWLEGRHNAYSPSSLSNGPDDETQHLIPTLAAVNRAGCVTTGSQPGQVAIDGARRWEQRAAVEAWVSDKQLLNRIQAGAKRARITVIAHGPSSGWRDGMVVTQVNGEPYTWFGRTMSRREQIAYEWPDVGGRATRELRRSTFLTLIDPVWGRDDRLWPALAGAIR